MHEYTYILYAHPTKSQRQKLSTKTVRGKKYLNYLQKIL